MEFIIEKVTTILNKHNIPLKDTELKYEYKYRLVPYTVRYNTNVYTNYRYEAYNEPVFISKYNNKYLEITNDICSINDIIFIKSNFFTSFHSWYNTFNNLIGKKVKFHILFSTIYAYTVDNHTYYMYDQILGSISFYSSITLGLSGMGYMCYTLYKELK